MAFETASVLYEAYFLFLDMCTDWWIYKVHDLHLHRLDLVTYMGAHTLTIFLYTDTALSL